jgi:ABC transporter C-terminal domain
LYPTHPPAPSLLFIRLRREQGRGGRTPNPSDSPSLAPTKSGKREGKGPGDGSKSVGLSASERKELERIEETILKAEEKVAAVEAKMASPEIATDASALQKLWNEDLPAAKAVVEKAYARWDELEARKNA